MVVTMETETIDEGMGDVQPTRVSEHGFAAVPIHFRPKEGATPKRVALVVPGIDPPLMFLEVSGSSPDDISITEVQGHVDSVSQSADSEAVETTEEGTEETPDVEEAPQEEEVEEEEQETENLEYPHETDQGEPVAGFLLAGEDETPPVIVVRPQEGESVEDAMTRVGEDNPGHIPGTLEEATKVLGHSPLTSED